MSDLYPIWCPTCARQGECHIGDTVPKCYEPKQTEQQMKCNTCKHYGVISVDCDRCDKSKHSRYEPKKERQTDCAWK